MSLSVFPSAPQAPGLGVGAAAPDGGAAAGFDALLAALFGETGQAQAAPAPAPAKTAGKAASAPVVEEDDVEASASSEDGEAVASSAETALLAAAAMPAPMTAQTEQTQAAPEQPVGAAVSAGGPAPRTPIETGAAPVASQAAPSVDAAGTNAAAVAEAAPEAPAPEEPASSAPQDAGGGDQVSSGEAEPQVSPHHASARAATETPKASLAPAPAPVPSAVAAPEPAAVSVTAPAPEPSAVTDSPAPASAATLTVAAQAAQNGATPVSEPALRSLRGQVSAERTEPAKPAAEKPAKAAAKPALDAAAPGAFALVQATPPAAQMADPKLNPAAPQAGIPDAPVPDVESADMAAELPELPAQAGASETAEASATPREASRLSATPETVANLAAQMSRKLQGRTTHFDIQLQPEGLGRVDVRVDIDAQGRLTAAMSFDNPHAAAELRGRSAELQRSLEQAGFDLSGGLSFQSSDDGGAGGRFAEQQAQRDFGGGRAFQSALGLASEADTPAAVASAYQQRRAATGVDIRI